MSQNMFRALFLGLITLAIVVAVILTIYPQDASVEDNSLSSANADQGKCDGADKIKWAYEAFEPPKRAPLSPFDAEGKGERTLADYRGLGLVVNFWATWCIPCVREMPSLDRLQAKLKGDVIRVLAISEDRGGLEKVKKFYADKDIRNLPILLDKRGKLMRASRILGLPTTLLINPKGKVVGRVTGVAEWDSPEIVNFLRSCLK